jgi:hypothetical protein
MKRIIVLFSILVLLVPFTAVAQIDCCEGNFDCDQDVDGTDASMFNSDYGRSSLENPCSSCVPLEPIEKTGQVECYDDLGNVINCAGTGQDESIKWDMKGTLIMVMEL